MNDRYLYRVKRTDNGEWVEGNLVWSDDADDDYKAIIIPTTGSNMFTRGGANADLGFEKWYRVDPSTICQCTGLKDKNGKLIWENDVVSFTHSKITSESLAKDLGFPDFEKEEYTRNYAIEFVNTYCTYGLRFRNKSIHFPCKASTLYMHDCVVIGNIFDNPELLEVGE